MEDVAKMKVADLKRELKNRNLSTIGIKTELMERLQSALLDGVELHDELLDESVLTDEDEANILAEDDDILQSPKSLKINVGVTKTDEDDLLLSPNAVTAPKKVVLKRKNSFKDLEETISKENAQPATEAKVLKMSERNPITISAPAETKESNEDAKSGSFKLSQLTEKERLEMRAKKFGQTVAAAAATAPAQTTTTTPAATGTPATAAVTSSTNSSVSNEQMEKLKKRAERFGVVSPAIAKLDESEKLLKRKERFGLNATSAAAGTASTATGGGDAWAEKARLRLERFKANESITATEKK